MLIKVNITKFHIKQSARNSRFIVGLEKFPPPARGVVLGERSTGEIARTNEQSILKLLPTRSGKKRIKTALFLLPCRSPTRGAFGNYSTFSFSRLSLLFSLSPSLPRPGLFLFLSLFPQRTLSCFPCREPYRINIKRIQYLRIRT